MNCAERAGFVRKRAGANGTLPERTVASAFFREREKPGTSPGSAGTVAPQGKRSLAPILWYQLGKRLIAGYLPPFSPIAIEEP